jgi:hypothetical protein
MTQKIRAPLDFIEHNPITITDFRPFRQVFCNFRADKAQVVSFVVDQADGNW